MDHIGKGMMSMTQQEFEKLLDRFSRAATAGDGKAFAACFTEDAVYNDYIYGPHKGRDSIADMLENLFHRDAADYHWQMFDPVCGGDMGYAWSLSRFTSTIAEFQGRHVVIDGMSRFRLRDGLIAEYWESVNGGVAMVQLGVSAPRIERVLQKWASWLKDKDVVRRYLDRKKDHQP
jgi:ketosteroid isomerase-like protein